MRNLWGKQKTRVKDFGWFKMAHFHTKKKEKGPSKQGRRLGKGTGLSVGSFARGIDRRSHTRKGDLRDRSFLSMV